MSIPKTVHIPELEQLNYWMEYQDAYRFELSLHKPKSKNSIFRSIRVYIKKDSFEVGEINVITNIGRKEKEMKLEETNLAHLAPQIIQYFEDRKLPLLFITSNGPSRISPFSLDTKIFWN